MMKKIFLTFLFLLTSINSYAAPPTRQNSYVSGTTILSADVTANEDAIFNYLLAGVDTFADGTIVNADINTSANIQSDKLNLGSIAQAVGITASGSLTNAGTTTLTGNVTINGGNLVIGTSSQGKIFYDNGTTVTGLAKDTNATRYLSNTGSSNNPAWAQITASNGISGQVPTANGGTGQDFSATAQGSIPYFSAAGTVSVLAPGTSGQFLKTQGAAANPTWVTPAMILSSVTTVTSGTTTGSIALTAGKNYKIIIKGYFSTDNQAVNIYFNADSGSNYQRATSTGQSSLNVFNSSSVNNSAQGPFSINMDLNYDQGDTSVVVGGLSAHGYVSTTSTFVDVGFLYNGSADVTAFNLEVGAGNLNATVYVYELSTS